VIATGDSARGRDVAPGARPGHRLRRDLRGFEVVLIREPLPEMQGEHGDVVAALAKRRHAHREDVEPIKQVFSELALRDQFSEVTVGGRDQAEVDRDRLPRADPGDLTILQHPEQFDLHSLRQRADLGTAPVNDPFMWPNNSDSIKVSGRAEQLMATNGRRLRPDSSWTARAASSLPVPVSPVMSTLARVGATRSISP